VVPAAWLSGRSHDVECHIGHGRGHAPLEHLILVKGAESGLDHTNPLVAHGLLRCGAEPILRSPPTKAAAAACRKRLAALRTSLRRDRRPALSHRALRQDALPLPAGQLRRDAVITGITKTAYITTKQDMSRWTRAHSDVPGINWSVFAGPGGTMIIVEHAEDRCSLNGTTVHTPRS
jgi:hypothetical protein